MAARVLAEVAASITELKANPMKVARSAYGDPVAILNRNEPAFYCVPAEIYEKMMDRLEDLELLQLVKERQGEESVSVSLDDL
ncbi:type II toxin-antitoxin system Phd/YefM family antitoxin [Alteromonas sp. ASW11-130]|uniref:type II toxin-antitoxin system Phd/YefM family antitoxin n=1 Tax=Alteromonas sp. ASW11-130 TaxID=3015775 RepID=UPI0022423858|nr:type II toxin-antitoxin system Phd/YefM family antitoxin [Alteromonas sp. ASW11-130]MCW8092248.1 type II toxin-antitoxin system Phd/YefM family antitoxin [Alteromonas sp. ASW11-130]